MDYQYKDRTGEEITCADCIYQYKAWYEEPCDGCCRAHSAYEPMGGGEDDSADQPAGDGK